LLIVARQLLPNKDFFINTNNKTHTDNKQCKLDSFANVTCVSHFLCHVLKLDRLPPIREKKNSSAIVIILIFQNKSILNIVQTILPFDSEIDAPLSNDSFACFFVVQRCNVRREKTKNLF
jgi:hypothetical protein